MATKLEKSLKREIAIDGEAYILTISPEGLLLTVKGRRKGQELSWKGLVSGDAALAAALNATLGEARKPPAARATKPAKRTKPTLVKKTTKR